MKISILTLFPQMFSGMIRESILKHAQQKGLVTIDTIDIRNFGIGLHKIVDDTPYGGGVGMVMRVDVIEPAISAAKNNSFNKDEQKVILLTASGKKFNQKIAEDYSKLKHLILVCGHYEGVDERIKDFIDTEISIGDFVLTGGEIPAMLITDAVTRLIPGVLKTGVTSNESFSLTENDKTLLEYPQYTKPQNYKSLPVPEILLSGNHKKIEEWRHKQSITKTEKNRPDLLA